MQSLLAYGPGGIMAIITIIALIAVWKYFTGVIKKLMIDFLSRTDAYNEVMKRTAENTAISNELLRDTKQVMQAVNLNLIELKARKGS